MECRFSLVFAAFDSVSAFRFLCVKLLANELITLNNVHDVRKYLRSIPTWLESIYDTILQRIHRQESHNRHLSMWTRILA